METRTYTEKSNARRAAKAAGVDLSLIHETDDGFTFPLPDLNTSAADPAIDDIPEFCKITQEDRRRAWIKNPPKAVATQKEITKVTKPKKEKTGIDKTAMLLSMLKGKGSTVEQLTKALDWLPHTLRARISRLPKDDKKIKIARERVDGVTSYRIA